MIPFTSKNQNQNEQNNNNNMKKTDIKPDIKDQQNIQKIPAILVPTPIIFNPMIKYQKNMYEK